MGEVAMGRGWVASILAGAIVVHISWAQAQESPPAPKQESPPALKDGDANWSCTSGVAGVREHPNGLVTLVSDKGPLPAQLRTAAIKAPEAKAGSGIPEANVGGGIPVVRGGQAELLLVNHVWSADLRYYAAAQTGLPVGGVTSTQPADAQPLDILGAQPSDTKSGWTELTVRMPDWFQLSWLPLLRPVITVYLAACPAIKTDGDPTYVAVASAQVSGWVWSWLLALVVVLALYGVLAWAFSEPAAGQPTSRKPVERLTGRLKALLTTSPLELSAGITGRSSLGNLQMLFFTLLTTWLFIYTAYRTGTWAALDLNLVAPFLIISGGTIIGRWMRASDQISVVNLHWLEDRNWISRRASLRDIFMSRGDPDPTRFQAVALSAVIGLALVIAFLNDRSDMGNATTILALLGASQATYVFGKYVKPDQPDERTLDEINAKLDEARAKEATFRTLVEALPSLQTKLKEITAPMADAKTKTSAVVSALDSLTTAAQQSGSPLSAMTSDINAVHVGMTDLRSALDGVQPQPTTWSDDLLPKLRSLKDAFDTQEAAMTKLLTGLQGLSLSGQPGESEILAFKRALEEWQGSMLDDVLQLASKPTYEAATNALAADTSLDSLNEQIKNALQEYGNAAAVAASLVADELDADLPSEGCYRLPLKRYLDAVRSPKVPVAAAAQVG
jgi:hypothetical protein